MGKIKKKSQKNIVKDLKRHLQTAIDVELSTIPIYLYTYYSIIRKPELNSSSEKQNIQLATWANKAGGVIMSVAVEEMLHLSLASNILKALGGKPKIYKRSPDHYPTNLEDHALGFSIGLTKLKESQLQGFMGIEKPEEPGDVAQGDQWETIGQFYQYISNLVEQTVDAHYIGNADYQLTDGRGYYAPNNVDTIYPTDMGYLKTPLDKKCPSQRGAKQANYPNSDDSGGLKEINCKADALAAIQEISHQGEGFIHEPDHKYDDPKHLEESHWYKFKSLFEELAEMGLSEKERKAFVYDFPDSPKVSDFDEKYHPILHLSDAVYSYLLWMTEASFTLKGSAQSSMFYIGMHKGMIFILDKLIGAVRETKTTDGVQLAPCFQNYKFKSKRTAKRELVKLCKKVIEDKTFSLSNDIFQRIKDLPDVYVVDNVVSFA